MINTFKTFLNSMKQYDTQLMEAVTEAYSTIFESKGSQETPRIFITNLGKYNEGEMVGEWIELPATEEEIRQVLQRIGINDQYEEYFVSSFEGFDPIDLDQHTSIAKFNQIAELIEDVDMDILGAIMNAGYKLDDAVQMFNDGDYTFLEADSGGHGNKDLALAYIEMRGGFSALDGETKQNHFDYEQFGRDAKMDLDSDEDVNEDDDEYGQELVNSHGIDNLGDETLERYFDYDSFGNELSADFHETSNGWISLR